jgi:general secretion pathway protein N
MANKVFAKRVFKPTVAYAAKASAGSATAAGSVWVGMVLGLLLGIAVALVAFAPAVWVERAVRSASQGRVQLYDSMGTVWNGSAQLALTGGQGSRGGLRLPGRVQWQLTLGWGVLDLDLGASCCTSTPMHLRLRPGWQRATVQMQAHQSRWPSAVLAGLGTPWNTVQLDGPLDLSTPGFSLQVALDRWTLEGSFQVQAHEISSRLSTLRPLGSYQFTLQGGAQPSVDLRTLRGSLQLSGQGRWTAGRLRFEGAATAAPEHAAELNNLLNILGRRDGARSVITLG